jgi:hypothetical protein
LPFCFFVFSLFGLFTFPFFRLPLISISAYSDFCLFRLRIFCFVFCCSFFAVPLAPSSFLFAAFLPHCFVISTFVATALFFFSSVRSAFCLFVLFLSCVFVLFLALRTFGFSASCFFGFNLFCIFRFGFLASFAFCNYILLY